MANITQQDRSSSLAGLVNNPEIPRTRPRAMTESLSPPVAEKDLARYTKERIQISLDYANRRLAAERKPSARTYFVLQMYKSACHQAINESTETILEEIRTYDENINTKFWLKKVLPEDVHKQVQLLTKLRWMNALAFYRDYFSLQTTELKNNAIKLEGEHQRLLAKKHNWTEIDSKLKQDKNFVARNGEPEDPGEVPHLAVFRDTCKFGVMDEDITANCIDLYSQSNQMFHSEIKDLVTAGSYARVAKLLYGAITDLWSIVPIDKIEEGYHIEEFLLMLRGTWFKIEDYDNWENWVPTETLQALATGLRKQPTPEKSSGEPAPQPSEEAQETSPEEPATPAKTEDTSTADLAPASVPATPRRTKEEEQLLLREHFRQPAPAPEEYRLPATGVVPGRRTADLHTPATKRKASNMNIETARRRKFRSLREHSTALREDAEELQQRRDERDVLVPNLRAMEADIAERVAAADIERKKVADINLQIKVGKMKFDDQAREYGSNVQEYRERYGSAPPEGADQPPTPEGQGSSPKEHEEEDMGLGIFYQ